MWTHWIWLCPTSPGLYHEVLLWKLPEDLDRLMVAGPHSGQPLCISCHYCLGHVYVRPVPIVAVQLKADPSWNESQTSESFRSFNFLWSHNFYSFHDLIQFHFHPVSGGWYCYSELRKTDIILFNKFLVLVCEFDTTSHLWHISSVLWCLYLGPLSFLTIVSQVYWVVAAIRPISFAGVSSSPGKARQGTEPQYDDAKSSLATSAGVAQNGGFWGVIDSFS